MGVNYLVKDSRVTAFASQMLLEGNFSDLHHEEMADRIRINLPGLLRIKILAPEHGDDPLLTRLKFQWLDRETEKVLIELVQTEINKGHSVTIEQESLTWPVDLVRCYENG